MNNGNKTLAKFMSRSSKQRVTISDLGDQSQEPSPKITDRFMSINGKRMY